MPISTAAADAGRCRGPLSFHHIKPGAYPWGNHHQRLAAGRISMFSLFGGPRTRLITQCISRRSLLALDPIYQFRARCGGAQTLQARSTSGHQNRFALGYRFDIVLRGRTPSP